jgi:hypothetical protein
MNGRVRANLVAHIIDPTVTYRAQRCQAFFRRQQIAGADLVAAPHRE